MKLIGWLILAAIALAALKAAAVVLLLAMIIGLLAALYVAPAETLGLIVIGVAIETVERHPLACIAVVALMAGAKLMRGAA